MLWKKTAAKKPVVNDGTPRLDTDLGRGINPPVPHGPTKPIEVFRVPTFEHRFRFTITALLTKIGLDGVATVMPDESGGTETQSISALLQSPANVHVITRFAVQGVETTDLNQGPPVEGHVASRNMLGETVIEHDVCRAAVGTP